MGFGLIFSGYISLLFFKVLPPAMLAGAYLMYKGLDKLSVYGKEYLRAKTMSLVLCAYYLIYSVIWILNGVGITKALIENSVFLTSDNILYNVLLIAFHIFLYYALEAMAKECGYAKGIKSVYFSRVLLTMFCASAVVNVVTVGIISVNTYMPLIMFICELAWFVYTAVTVYGFYRHIVTDNVLKKEEEILNKLRESQNISKNSRKERK